VTSCDQEIPDPFTWMAYEDLNKKDGDVEDEAAPENHMDSYIKGPVGSSVGDEYPQLLQKDDALTKKMVMQ